ncbi:MAG: HAMP domain-containing histidine kinase [Lachnospiraceae bacterium]|nr:HAMP domain-containing histidine kinase [Lachnospiraceae bacterium]
MKKPTLKRIGLGFVQHLLAVCIFVAIAGILFNSCLSVESMEGTKTYNLSPLQTEPVFEDSELFRDIFETAVSDVTKLVVMKGQLETGGAFDPHKKIDVTKFASRKGSGNNCQVTAVYELEDLIKWGKNGVLYSNRPMSMSEFVNYFAPATASENFALDEDGKLYFRGYYNLEEGSVPVYSLPMEIGREELSEVEQEMLSYTTDELEDMAFSYIMSQNLDSINMSKEDDGSYTVYVQMLNCKYPTVDGEKQLYSYAANWIDFVKLQQNVAETIEALTTNYQQYLNCYELYEENNGNLKYVVRMLTDEGTQTFTNVSELTQMEDSAITDYFEEFHRYLIYYPDSLVFMGNSSMSEADIYGYLNVYEYAYPETSHIWIGVDTSYINTGDAFYQANYIFNKIVPNIGMILAVIIFLGIIWVCIGIYLTFTAGVAFDENQNKVHYLNGIDRIWTEIIPILFVGLIYGAIYGGKLLQGVLQNVYLKRGQSATDVAETVYDYGYFALFGFLISMLSAILWYSIVRRIRSNSLWADSFVKWMIVSIKKIANFLFRHKNMAVNTLLPYNLFLFTNLIGIILIVKFHEKLTLAILFGVGIVLIDGFVGVLLFKKSAEQMDIVEGINRIRDGEVDYKLDPESLHGVNRDMADAVNNIGEGIRNAVRTSMKDEQMKTDLITNVSHDLKTPLTSIVSYVDLLKRLRIKEEPAKSYIDVLNNKAQRLKQLTDDLVEASKISSGNIELKNEKLNLTELLNQSLGEFSEKLEEQNLQVVFENNSAPAYIFADSRRMWRVVENLFNNICKYALEGTRVYVDLLSADENISVVFKNISKRQMNIHADELTERFIRGDSARSTEGSGLGLSIAKSLTQLQGGSFEIELDGDLFKVVLGFKEYKEEDKKDETNPEEPDSGSNRSDS